MFSLNRAEILGNLTRDPETRSLPSGQTVCSFAVATNRRWRDKEGNTKEDTQYHEVTVWGKLGELAAQMLTRGKKVYVEGRLQTTNWEGTDGVKRNKTEIIADNFIPLSPKEGGSTWNELGKGAPSFPAGETSNKKSEKTEGAESVGTTDEINLDDIPF